MLCDEYNFFSNLLVGVRSPANSLTQMKQCTNPFFFSLVVSYLVWSLSLSYPPLKMTHHLFVGESKMAALFMINQLLVTLSTQG